MKRLSGNRFGVAGMLVVLLGAVSASVHATLILNSSFESPVADSTEPAPDYWPFFTSGPNSSGVVSSQFARTGGQVLQFYAPPEPENVGSYQGYFQATNISLAVSNRIIYSVWIRSSPFLPLGGNATGKIGVEFKYTNAEQYRVELVFTAAMISTGEWKLFTIDTYNTTVVDQLVFTITQVNGGSLPNFGIFWADDGFAEVVPEPSVLGLLLAGGWVVHTARKRFVKKRN